MSLALLGFATVVVFIGLIMTKRLSAVAALIGVPIVTGLVALAGNGDLGAMAINGMQQVAPIALLLSFAILYFGIMMDAGLFDPLVDRILRLVGDDPLRITIGTTALAALVSVDGDGTTTTLIVISAMLPVYRRIQMNPMILATLLGSANAIMNYVPWGGPSARAAAALKVDLVSQVFLPLIPAMAIGLAATFAIAWHFGQSERRRLAWVPATAAPLAGSGPSPTAAPGQERERPPERRPHLFWLNLALTLALMAGMFTGLVPLPLLMMGAFALAVTINYPAVAEQRKRIEAHASNVVMVVVLIFAAGLMTGILEGTGMLEAMGQSVVSAIPSALGPYLAPITALLSLPLLFLMSNDAYYFGILPIIAQAAGTFGIAPEVIARASMIGQPVHNLSPLLAPIYLACGLLGIEVADVQKFAVKYAVLLAFVLFAGAAVSGAIPLSP